MLEAQNSIKSRCLGAFFLMRLHRPAGKLLLLWPTLMALWLASDGHPSGKLFLIFTLGVFVMSCAGCVINDWADRHVDGHVRRTKERPLITQAFKPQEALVLFVVLLSMAFFLVLGTNAFTCLLSIGGVLLATLYPFMKRYTYFPQVVLGAAYGWAVPMAYAAQTQTLPLECWLLYVATLLWTVAYDTIYAMADREDDIKINVKSTAIFFGKYDKIAVLLLQVLTLSLFALIGRRLKLNGYFGLSISLAFLLMLYQQWLIKDRVPKDCIKAFIHNQWFGAVLFVGVLLGV